VWPYLEDLFRSSDEEARLVGAGVGVDPGSVRDEVEAVLNTVIERATLNLPDGAPVGRLGGRSGRQGVHTEYMGHVLAEMQSLARQHPGTMW
jgi:ring-1,2-phenylacetyl-CoA epoxidase subunit PaaC